MWDELAIAYFIALAVLAVTRPLPAARRVLVVGIAAVTTAAVYGLPDSAVRDWSPTLILLAAYYLSGLLLVQPSPGIEAWLMKWDRRLLGDPSRAFEGWPPWLLATLDILYLNTFLIVPAGFAMLWLAGETRLADRFWTIVMGSLLICYAGTALVHTRPPRTLERAHERAAEPMRRVAFQAVETFSIGANTIPSGHVAAPLAVGLALIDPLPWAGAAFLILTLVITAACLTGRYHFIVDCVLGAVAAILVWLLAAGLTT